MKLVVESQIKGAFRGWKGGTNVFQLTNGQAWKQSHYKYQYHYAYQPKAKIWQDGSTYYLEVDGMGEKIEVRKATSSDIEEAEQDDN